MILAIEAGYVYLSHEPVARTVEINDGLLVDVDADGKVIGIEVIGHALTSDDLMAIIRSVTLRPPPCLLLEAS